MEFSATLRRLRRLPLKNKLNRVPKTFKHLPAQGFRTLIFPRNDEEQNNQRMPAPRQRLLCGWLNLGPTLEWGFGSRVEDSCSSKECEGVPRLSILGHWNLIPFWHRMASEPKKCHKVSKSRGIRQGLMSLRLSKYGFFLQELFLTHRNPFIVRGGKPLKGFK